MDFVRIGLAAAAGIASIAFCLVLLPRILDRRGELPYNSVRSRLVAWSAFGGMMAAIVAAVGGFGWSAAEWATMVALLAFAALWDVYDLRNRRIPRGRHPDR